MCWIFEVWLAFAFLHLLFLHSNSCVALHSNAFHQNWLEARRSQHEILKVGAKRVCIQYLSCADVFEHVFSAFSRFCSRLRGRGTWTVLHVQHALCAMCCRRRRRAFNPVDDNFVVIARDTMFGAQTYTASVVHFFLLHLLCTPFLSLFRK